MRVILFVLFLLHISLLASSLTVTFPAGGSIVNFTNGFKFEWTSTKYVEVSAKGLFLSTIYLEPMLFILLKARHSFNSSFDPSHIEIFLRNSEHDPPVLF
jgi:ABC-type polysaccharide/polyol phosphate export permease